jgi:hypothetical protein
MKERKRKERKMRWKWMRSNQISNNEKSENKECQIITRNSKWYDSCSTIFEGSEKREQEKE